MATCSFGLPYVVYVFWLIVILVISHFGFEGGTLVLIASVPGRCLSFTSFSLCGKRGKKNIEKPTEHVVHIPVLRYSHQQLT